MKMLTKSCIRISLILLITVALNAQVIQLPASYPEQTQSLSTEFMFNSANKSLEKELSYQHKKHNIKNTSNSLKQYQFSSKILTARYVPPTVKKVKEIVKKYKSIPGGVTLEGATKGIEKVEDVVFDKKNNIFIINKEQVIHNSISVNETKEIFNSIYNNDLFGISLGEKPLIYGDLIRGSIPYINLTLLDHFLGTIVFAGSKWTAFHNFPNSYRPKKDRNSKGIYAVYFNLKDFKMNKTLNRYFPDKFDLEITLVPLTENKDENGGYIPDYEKIKNNTISKYFEDNVRHIVQEINHYSTDSRFQKVMAYGHAAALARLFKANNISPLKLGLI